MLLLSVVTMNQFKEYMDDYKEQLVNDLDYEFWEDFFMFIELFDLLYL